MSAALIHALLSASHTPTTPTPTPTPTPPPGTPIVPASIIPAAPSPDAAALRFQGGTAPYVETVTPATSVATIRAWMQRTVTMRNNWGTDPRDYRLILVAEPGVYNWEGLGHLELWTSVISASGSGEPDVIFEDWEGSWGTMEGSRHHFEGLRIQCTALSKYPIHQYGGRAHLAHCWLEVTGIGWGSGACFGHDGYPGDTIQMFDTRFTNPSGSSWSINSHATANGEDAHLSFRFKGCDFTDATAMSFGGARKELIWVEDCPGLTYSTTWLDLQATPLVWDQV